MRFTCEKIGKQKQKLFSKAISKGYFFKRTVKFYPTSIRYFDRVKDFIFNFKNMPFRLTIFSFLFLLTVVVISCSSNEVSENNSANTNQNSNQDVSNEPQDGNLDNAAEENLTSENPPNNANLDNNNLSESQPASQPDSVSSRVSRSNPAATSRSPRPRTIKEHYYAGNYNYIIRQQFSKNQLKDFYYKAFAYYGIARGIKNNPNLKQRYIERSKEILKKVGTHANNKELKARAILWYGILRNVFPREKLNNYQKISPFAYIKTRLPETSSYDDALFYSGLIYENVGYYKSAKINYSKLDSIAPGNYIYYYARRKVYPAKTISNYYLKNINRKLEDLRRRNSRRAAQNANPIPQAPVPTPNTEAESGIESFNDPDAQNNDTSLFPTETVDGTDTSLGIDDSGIDNSGLDDNGALSLEAIPPVDDDFVFVDEAETPAQAIENSNLNDNEASGLKSQPQDDFSEEKLSDPADDLDLSLDRFIKNSQKKNSNQDIFILDDN